MSEKRDTVPEAIRKHHAIRERPHRETYFTLAAAEDRYQWPIGSIIEEEYGMERALRIVWRYDHNTRTERALRIVWRYDHNTRTLTLMPYSYFWRVAALMKAALSWLQRLGSK